MLNRFEPALRIASYILAGVFLLQVSRFAVGADPLKNLRVPALPVLSATNNAQATPPPAPTNAAGPARTNQAGIAQTNTALTNGTPGKTNVVATSPTAATNAVLPAAQARVQKIVQSEILGPVIRPLPMALLGIAGDDAFLRAPNGQTGMVKEGGELGGIKLLKIGVNRVLVEEAGQKKELTIFSGFGSESLLPKEGNP